MRNDYESTVEQKVHGEKSSAVHIQELTEQYEKTKQIFESIREAYDKLYSEHSETEQRLQDEILKVCTP